MELIDNVLRIEYSDADINAMLEGVPADAERPLARHFSQGEEFFLRLEEPFEVPSLPVHHDVRRAVPERDYLARLARTVAGLAQLAPQVLRDLTYFFDPAETLRPCFFRVYQVQDSLYLYLLSIDLALHCGAGEVLEGGTNDATPRYRGRDLFIEPVVIPLAEVAREGGRISSLCVRQVLSETWIGEQGVRGFDRQGVWLDRDLTKFFSRLLLPPGARTYPFYPYLCKHRSVCEALLDLSVDGRRRAAPRLHRAIAFLLPSIQRIREAVQEAPFSEDLALFRELKATVPEAWYAPWRGIRVEAYLNEQDHKEFRIDA